MKRAQIAEKVRGVICEQLGVELEAVTPTANLEADLGADSIDETELVMALEDAFDIDIPDDVREVKTVQDVMDVVTEIIGPKN